MTNALVERTIYCRRDRGWEAGLISVFLPRKDLEFDEHGQTWRCDIKINWPGFSCEKRHLGGDAYQALELAFRLVPTLIAATDDFRDGNLSLYEGEVILNSNTIREFFAARILGDV